MAVHQSFLIDVLLFASAQLREKTLVATLADFFGICSFRALPPSEFSDEPQKDFLLRVDIVSKASLPMLPSLFIYPNKETLQ